MAAQDAELQLKVSLDLAFFRQQLSGLGQAAAGYNVPINVKFDRRAIQNELNALGRNISQRTYRLEVATNIESQIKYAGTLADRLNALTSKTYEVRVAIKGVGGKTPAQQVDELQNIFGRGKTGEAFGAGAVATARAATARQGLLERLGKKSATTGGKVTGYNIPGLKRVIEELGGTPSGDRKALVKQATDLAKKVDDALINRVWASVKDLQMNMKYSGGAGYGVGQSISKMINSMSLVSSDPKNARNILRSLPPKYITTELAGRASEQSMANMALGQASAPVSSKFQNSFDKYLSALLAQSMADASIARRRYLERTSPLKALWEGTVPPRSYFRFGQGPQVPGYPIQSALPPAGTTSNYGGRGGFVPPPPPPPLSSPSPSPSGGGRGGFVPPPPPPPPSPSPSGGGGRGVALAYPGGGMGPSSQLGAGYYAVGKGLQSIKQAYAGVRTFLDTKRLPLSGAIAELAGEFGTAIKQVLLYGTAYKALAFFTSLPGQAFEAAKGLATYRNQLQAVTAESKTFDQSLAFVDNLAQRFNVPLESARQGFVKLYASMQPAGFGQDQIEGLFTGISKAAAAFGLSSDKVDRVNYAFAQMASKGQIMSEELKGQLGDVLPGALALFAQAAQMSIPEFSKAMEDGAFKGKAMTQVLDNVAILMNTKFGPAAQGAAKTLQGALNQMQNNLQLMYESFTPVVNAFAATFGPQVNSLIKDVTSTMQALTGTFLQAGEGFNTLSPRAQGFYTAIKDLEPAVRQAGAALLDLGSRFASLLPAIVNAVAATISFASSPLGRAALLATVAISTLTATLNILETTGIKAAVKAVYVFIGSLLKIPAATGIARAGIIALKLAITGLVIGGILMGLDLLIGRLLKIGDTANDSEKDLRGMKKALDDMAGSQDIEGTSRAYLNAKTKLAAARIENEKAFKELYNAKLAENLNDDPRAAIAAVTAARLKSEKTYNNVINAQKELQAAERARANAVALKERQDKETQGALQKIDLSGGEGKKQSLESYYSLQDQLAKAQTQADIDRIQSEFDHKFKLLNSYYDLQEARANSFQKITIAFQKELLLIEQRRQEATLKARLDVMKAQNSIAGGTSGTGGTGGGGRGLGSGISGYITGDPSSPYYQADHGGSNYHEHLSFVSRQAAEEAYNKLRGAGIQVTEFLGKSRVGRHTTGSAHYGGLAFDVPGAQVPVGKERELTARVQAILGIGGRATSGAAVAAGAPRKVTGNEKRDLLAEQAASNAQIAQSTINLRANEMAAKETEIAFANYVAAIAPAAEQELQNRLLQKRIDLMSSGVTGEFLETQIKIFEAEEKTRIAGQLLDKNNKSQAAGYEALKTALPGYIVLLKAAALAQQSVAFATAKSELNQRLAMARVFTADDELRVGLAQKYPGDIGKQTEEFDLTKRVMMIEKAKENLQNMASSISNAFGEAFKGIITGSSSVRDALAGLFQSIADSFADMVAQMITEWLKTQLVKGFASLFSSFIPGAGSSIAPGPVAQSAGVVQRPGFYGPAFANGGIAVGGFTAFAAGGVVSGPTLGLVGEGRYNEAIIPLPDGKSVPVDLGDTMGGTGGEISTNIVINVNNGQMQKEGGGNASSLGRKMEGAVKQVIVNELRPGGVLAGRR